MTELEKNIMPETAQDFEFETIAEFAEYFVQKNNNHPYNAAREMAEFIQKPGNESLFFEVMGPMAVNACYNHVRNVYQRERQVIWDAPSNAQGNRSRAHSLAQSNANSLMEFALPITGMPRLGDCTAEKIEEAENYYRTHAKSYLTRATFLDKIVSSMDGNRRVRDQFTEEALRRYQEEASTEQ